MDALKVSEKILKMGHLALIILSMLINLPYQKKVWLDDTKSIIFAKNISNRTLKYD